MTEIKKAEELVAVAARQGVKMSLVEADIVLGYMEGHGYALMSDEQYRVMLHDTEEEEKYGYSNNEPYSIRAAVEFCQEMNGELLQEASDKEQRNESYIRDLRKDEFILDGLMEKAAAVIPPVIRQYNIVILEHLKRVVSVEAASWEEAKTKVEREWNSGEHVLGSEDFAGVNFNTAG